MKTVYRYLRSLNTSMKVFSKLFVGISTCKDGEIPLAFATPYENNAAGRKREETVLNWLKTRRIPVTKDGRYVYEGTEIQYLPDASTTRIIDNVPREGFHITDDVKRVYWGGGNVVWRVADPDGWEVEIQSANLMALIQSTTIEAGGRIVGKCVWGRSDGVNVLLHESSEEYKNAVHAAETIKPAKQLSKQGREIGSVYRLTNGTLVVYYGKVHVTKIDYEKNGNLRTWYTNLKFPRLPECEEKVSLSGTGICIEYFIQPSTEYEAVAAYDEKTGKREDTLVLYRKAPLQELVHERALEVPKITNEFLSSFAWSFASNGVTCVRISSVTVEPIKKPAVKFVPWSEADYEKAERTLDVESKNSNTSRFGNLSTHWFRAREHAVMVDGQMCGSIYSTGTNSFKSARKEKLLPRLLFAQPLIIGRESYKVLDGTDDMRHVYGPNDYHDYRMFLTGITHQLRTRYKEYPVPDEVKVLPITGVDSFDTTMSWFKELKETKALYHITVGNKDE